MDPKTLAQQAAHFSWAGMTVMAVGTAVFLFCMGMVSRKLAEALHGPRYYVVHFLAAALALSAPLGEMLTHLGPAHWFTGQMTFALAVGVLPTFAHWHWLLLGEET